jgi:hypothetical protein
MLTMGEPRIVEDEPDTDEPVGDDAPTAPPDTVTDVNGSVATTTDEDDDL